MKVLAIITFVALGALVNGQDDAVGVIGKLITPDMNNIEILWPM